MPAIYLPLEGKVKGAALTVHRRAFTTAPPLRCLKGKAYYRPPLIRAVQRISAQNLSDPSGRTKSTNQITPEEALSQETAGATPGVIR